MRVGRNNGKDYIAEQHGEDSVNKNGQQVIDFCLNNMIVGNTHFKHKDIHK